MQAPRQDKPQDKPQDKTSPKTRQTTRQDKPQDKTNHKTRQDKPRPGQTRQDKTRQDKTRRTISSGGNAVSLTFHNRTHKNREKCEDTSERGVRHKLVLSVLFLMSHEPVLSVCLIFLIGFFLSVLLLVDPFRSSFLIGPFLSFFFCLLSDCSG
jgi:hypothetical protein